VLRKLIPEAVCVHVKNVRVNMRLVSKNKHVSIDGLSEPEVKSKIDHHAAINKKSLTNCFNLLPFFPNPFLFAKSGNNRYL
jgi:hypothetical protein